MISLALLSVHEELHVATLGILITQLVLQVARELLQVRLNSMNVELVLHVKLAVTIQTCQLSFDGSACGNLLLFLLHGDFVILYSRCRPSSATT